MGAPWGRYPWASGTYHGSGSPVTALDAGIGVFTAGMNRTLSSDCRFPGAHGRSECPLWVISGHCRLREEESALTLEADIAELGHRRPLCARTRYLACAARGGVTL